MRISINAFVVFYWLAVEEIQSNIDRVQKKLPTGERPCNQFSSGLVGK